MTYARLSEGPEAAVAAALSGDVDGIAVATSGSTGTPREVHLSGPALRASAEATSARLTGPGAWLLALPADRIAGSQVLVRSALARTSPIRLPSGPFTAVGFAAAADELFRSTPANMPRYTSLVPTQLRRVLADPRASSALASFTSVLVGGASLGNLKGPGNVIETYGMTETAGGCVYDGVPLDGVDVAIGDNGGILISGDVLADGYVDGDDSSFPTIGGTRWFATSDVGQIRSAKLSVLGRSDSMIVTGAFKVHPESVERALDALPDVAQSVVVGVPDPEWGTRIVALAIAADSASNLTTESVRARLESTLPNYALPRDVRLIDSLPLLDTGKIDREAARTFALQ